jgi:pSer/pThr/pTyr-binding forkhead associated (FHA) protein
MTRNTPPEMIGRPERAYLIHASEKQTYALLKTTFTIGRDPSSHLQVLDTEVSREQAEIRYLEGGHVLVPVGKGLTKVNGAAVTETIRLNEGDLISIGEISLVYTRRSPSGAIVTEAGWADDIRVAEASTETERKYQPGQFKTKTGSRAALFVIIPTVLILLVWIFVIMR